MFQCRGKVGRLFALEINRKRYLKRVARWGPSETPIIQTRVGEKQMRSTERLKRLGRAYVDGMFNELDYGWEKQYLEMELEILVILGVEAVEEAGRLVEYQLDLRGQLN